MANPAGYMNTYSPQPADGVHPGTIPNGQPPQFNRQPIFPQKVAPPRPAMIGQQPSFSSHQFASNGQHSHPSSLSSHSSRNPSPTPLRLGEESLSASTPNLANRPPSQNRVFDAPPPQMSPAPPNNPPMMNNHQYAPPSAGVPNAGSVPPYLGLNNSAAGHQRQTYVQQNNSTTTTTQNVPNLPQTVAASQPNLGPIRHHQMPPPPPSTQPPQLLPSLSNSPLNSARPVAGLQSGVIRPQMTPPNLSSNLPNSQFGTDRQFAPNVNQMPLNSPQPAPSYQSGLIRPQMPPNMSQIPLNPQLVGPSRQLIPNPQTSLNSQQMPPAQFNSVQTPNQMLPPPPSKMVPPNQGYTNPNIPPKSVLNLNNGARYLEPSYGATSQPPKQGPPRSGMAQNRYPAAPQPQSAPLTPRTNALGTLPPLPPGQAPPQLDDVGSAPGTPQNRPPQSRMAPYQSMPPLGPQPGPPPVPAGMGYAQPPAIVPPVFAPPQSPSHGNEGLGSHLGKRYPTQSQPYTNQIQPSVDTSAMNQQMASMSVAQHGFQKLWGGNSYDLLQQRNILPPEKVETPKVKLHQEFLDSVNCSPEIFRCTMTKIPETSSLLQKSRLPLGILIHPFKDLNECRLDDQGEHSSIDGDECASDYSPSLKHLAVIQCSSIVRCRACRTYINPFVYFVDHKRWKCNLCFRVNELPEEFQFDPVSKTYGDPTRRPEIKSATIEFIAPSEYMLRPPQPAVYLFLLDVSRLGVECGYLQLFCATLIDELDKLPGDGRTQVGFITYNSAVHFYSLAEGLNQPQQMIVVDVDDIFLPVPDSLIVNLNESKELIRDLLTQLPIKFQDSSDTHSALGPALQAAYKLMVRGHEGHPQPDLHDFERCSHRVPYYKRKAPTGGRVTVFQSCLPNFGPGALVAREDPTLRAGKEAPHLNPATDFYKRLALDCSGQQIAVDLFIVNSQYCDLATLSGISRFSGGCIHHIPLFKATNPQHADKLQHSLRRYLSRKLGMEAVMRIRCSRGLSIHTFHGNFFVRSTDLLSLPNVNPDAGFGMQVSVEENLSDLQNVCFQAALLYTSTKGERRIRVHTMCLPVCANLADVIHSADQQCIVGLLAKMGVDRSHQSSLSDARDAFINVAIDVLSAYRVSQASTGTSALLVPHNLRLLPLYILALLKYVAFRTGQSTRLDDRLFAMCQMKTLPLANLMQEIYPDLYPIHNLGDHGEIDVEGTIVPQPPRLQLTSEKLETAGAYLLDAGDHMIVFVGRNVNATFCQAVLGVQSFAHVSEDILDIPEVDTPESERLRRFVNHLQTEKSYPATIQLIRDDSQMRVKFYERLIEDRTESALSYYEFLQHLKTNVK